MMKILVTGGAGFIGHNLVGRLESEGHECQIIDNLTNYGVVPEEEMAKLHAERRKYYISPIHLIDLEQNTDEVNNVTERFQPDVIIHLAGYPGQQFIDANPRTATDIMVGGTVSVLEAAKKYKVPRFVYVSSSMIYGNFATDVDEFADTNPVNQYGIFKLMGEWLVKNYSKKTKMQYNIVRPSAVYGERSIKDKVINKFFLAAINGKPLEVKGADERLDFTYVDDVSEGLLLAALYPKNQIFNITRSESRTLLEAAETVVKIVGRGEIKVMGRDMNTPSRGRLKIDAAVSELGFYPKTDIEEGFQKCYEWIRDTVR